VLTSVVPPIRGVVMPLVSFLSLLQQTFDRVATDMAKRSERASRVDEPLTCQSIASSERVRDGLR